MSCTSSDAYQENVVSQSLSIIQFGDDDESEMSFGVEGNWGACDSDDEGL
jgi:hypothetical protein